jgi:hypothetical protein
MPPPREIMEVMTPPLGLVVVLGPLCLAIVVLLIIDLIDRMTPSPQPPPESGPQARIYARHPTPIWRLYAPWRDSPGRGRMTPQK